MNLTKVRLVDLDDTIDIGNGKSFKEQILDSRNIATDGTAETYFNIGSTTSGTTNTELRFGDYNGADLPPTLRYNATTTKIQFSTTPTTPSTFEDLVVLSDLDPYYDHIVLTDASAHGGLVKSIGTVDSEEDEKVAPQIGDFNFKDNEQVTWTLNPTSKMMTAQVLSSPALSLTSWDGGDGDTTALGGDWFLLTTTQDVAINGAVGTTEDIVLTLPTGYETLATVPTHVSLVYASGISTRGTVAVFFDGTTPFTTTELKVRVTTLVDTAVTFRVLISTWVRQV